MLSFRLGVGAPVPETQNFSREAARLKGQLTGRGTKRTQEDEAEVKKDKLESSDEEESRARAIKKKARLDPFGDGNGKRKKKRQAAPDDSAGSTSAALAVPDVEMSEQAEVVGMVTEADSMTDAQLAVPQAPPQSPLYDSSANRPGQLHPAPAKPTSIPSESIHNNRHTPEKPPGKRLYSLPPPCLPNDPTAKGFAQRSPNTRQFMDTSLTSAPVLPSSGRSLSFQSTEILKKPVLNLNPLSSDENSDQEAGPEALSPKKKRKRRKKRKKHSQLNDVATTAKSNGNV
jgi:hypothetical protein